jgi:hypothetical protein
MMARVRFLEVKTMGTVRRSSILTSVGFAAFSCLLAGRVAAQPLVATVGIVPDVCADPVQTECTTGTLFVVNGETLQIQTSMYLWRGTQAGSLQNLVVHPSGMFLYAAFRSTSPILPFQKWVDVIDLRTMTKLRQYDVFGDLKTISPDGTRLYLTTTTSVLVIDSASGGDISSIPLDLPFDIAIAPGRGRIYVACRLTTTAFSKVAVLDSATNALLKNITVFAFVSQLQLTPDESHLYALAPPAGRVFDIDPASNTISGVITDFGGLTLPIALTVARGHIYVAASAQSPVGTGDRIAVIDVATRGLVTTIGVFDPVFAEASTDGSRVWTNTLGEPRIITIDTATNQRIGSVTVPGGPLDLAAMPTNRTAEMVIDQPPAGSTVYQPFSLSGWAVDVTGVLPGPGVDTVHVWAYPAAGGAPTFVGADYGRSRPDLGAIFGPTFINSGYNVLVRGLSPGAYHLVAYAHSTRTGEFSIVRAVVVTIGVRPWLVVDTPIAGSLVEPRFTIAGWALDEVAQTGTGIDAVHVWAYPSGGGSPVFAGAATLGDARPDVAAMFGPRFANAGYHLDVSSLFPGAYTLIVYGHSTVTGAFSVEQHVPVTVAGPLPLLSVDTPAPNATVGSTFVVAGWAVEFNATAGTGVDLIHIWATSPTGTATFLGAAAYGFERPDVGAWLGPQYTPSGFALTASLPAGGYTLSVYARSTATGTFRNLRTVEILVQ